MEEQLYTTTKVAKIFGVTPRTVQMWADSGMIRVTKTLGGHRRITAQEVDRLARNWAKTHLSRRPRTRLLIQQEKRKAQQLMWSE